jgi:hypothetical protein
MTEEEKTIDELIRQLMGNKKPLACIKVLNEKGVKLVCDPVEIPQHAPILEIKGKKRYL